MEQITRQSCYLRLKEKLINEEGLFLIDKNGSYSQKEAFDIYCGYLNQFSLFVKENKVCLIAPYAKKETVLIVAAIISLGGIVVVGDPKMDRESFINLINGDIKIDLLISYRGDSWKIKSNDEWHDILTKQDDLKVKPLLESRIDKPSFYFLTAGTTGSSKIVALSEYSFLNHLVRQKSDLGPDEGIGYFCLPLYHVFGLGVLLQALLTGHALYVSDTRNYSYALEVIEKYRCTSIANVPTFFYMLIEESKKQNRDISSLKYGVIAGGAYSKEQFIKVEQSLNMTLCSSYGMSEASTCICNSPISSPLEERIAGVGKPFPGVEVVFKNDKGLFEKRQGEICFKGYNLMLGYVKGNKLSLPLDKDGYFHTGDIGCLDDSNIVHIIGRKKNIIIRGGENLSPTIIEQKIMSIPFVEDVCVVGLPDEKYGEIVAAYIASKTKKDIIVSALTKVLIKREIPEIILINNCLPLLSNGKHDYQLIKVLLAKEKDSHYE